MIVIFMLEILLSAFRIKVEKNRSITNISSDYGYSSSNYSSVFKQHHNLSPMEFRRNINQKPLINLLFRKVVELESFDDCNKKIL